MQIKNVPPDVHRTMQRRAEEAGQSLQAYMLARLTEQASKPTLKELFARAGRPAGGSLPLEDATRMIREERDSRAA